MAFKKKDPKLDHESCDNPLCKCHALTQRKPRNIRQASKSQEDRIAKEYQKAGFPKAHRVLGSGAFKKRVMVGDVDTEDLLLVEAKESRRGTLTIKPEWIDQVTREAKDKGRPWACLHAWVAKNNENFRKVVIVEESTWLDLLKQLKDSEHD